MTPKPPPGHFRPGEDPAISMILWREGGAVNTERSWPRASGRLDVSLREASHRSGTKEDQAP
jgi:hypothetical protein